MIAVNLEHGLNGVRCEAAGATRRADILFLHGMNGGAWQFESLQPFFAARGHASLALNYRGHHGSRPQRSIGRVSVEDYVDDASLAARALDRPIVIGQSIGGLVAQKLAEAGLARALVAMVSLPPRGIVWRGSARLLWTSLASLPAVLRGRELLASRSSLEALIFNCVEPQERAHMYARQVPESSWAGFQVGFGAIAVDASRVRCPVLSVTAERDRLVLPSVGAAIAAKYGGELLALPACGHYALVGEAGWRLRAEAIAAWLDRIEVRT